ncbi:MAG: hypothetical protein QT05_C0031G0006 [archaeon GW2011_AR13]|nr:MAG: hypothetical protein QT05_C0031G0006 [archaeon GW2011_AR13]HIG94834.1 hypothetical protein [Nanoarchaeota archaeon]HIH63534.1 hypothetical protein [Nanoarchaeota archaeon]HIJ09463.1 hypothetical protein [Nanoarchaeota archaeon]
MKKRESIKKYFWIFLFIFIILFLIGLFYAFDNITVNILKFEIKNGAVINGSLQEKTINRINTLFDSYETGFYDLEVYDDENNLIKQVKKTGAGFYTYFLQRYVGCARVVIFNSNTQKHLDTKYVCKK